MADIYYNPETGSNSTGTGTFANPFRTPLASHGAVGDTFWLKRGSLHLIDTAFGWQPRRANGPAGPWSFVRAWGEASIPHAIIDNANASGPTINIAASTTANSNLWIEDIWAKADFHPQSPIHVHSQTGNWHNLVCKRIKVTGRPGGSISGLFRVSSDFPEDVSMFNLLIEDSEFYDGSSHGCINSSVINAVYRRCKFARNGQEIGAHGGSALRIRVDVTSGWTVASGSVFQRTMTQILRSTTDVSHVTVLSGSSSGTYPRLNRNTSTPTSPAPGEYGWVPGAGTGVLYVNLNGTSPNGQTLTVCYGTPTVVRFEYCEAWDNKAKEGYQWREGHGIAFDDYTSDSAIIGCHMWNNEGAGISINRGDNNVISGNVIHDNLWPGIVLNRARGNLLANNNVRRNNVATTNKGFTNTSVSEVSFSATSTGNAASNNSIESVTRDFGLRVSADSVSGSSATTNAIIAPVARVDGITETSPVSVASFDDYVRPDGSLILPKDATLASLATDNPLALAGTYVQGVHLQNGRMRPGFCPVGAYQAVLPKGTRA